MGNFDDLIPAGNVPAGNFDDLIPQGQQQVAQQPNIVQGGFLPISRNLDTGEISFDPSAGFIGALADAVTLPSDVMAGRVDLQSEEGIRKNIGRVTDLAGFGVGGTPTRLAARGPEALAPTPAAAPVAGPASGQAVAAASQRLGADVPRAVTSDSSVIQQLGTVSQSVPGGGQPLRVASERSILRIGDEASRIERSLGGGDVAVAGSQVKEGLTQFITETTKQRIKSAYDAVDELVNPTVSRPLTATRDMVAKITQRRRNAGLGDSRAVALVREAAAREGGLNFQGVKDLRTTIGEMLDNPSRLPAKTSEGELKQIYASLSDDLKATASAAGGAPAAKAFDAANTLNAKLSDERKALNKILGTRSDEGVFRTILAKAGKTSTADVKGLAQVKRSVSRDTWDDMSSAVLAQLGRATDGSFSPDRFVTAYGARGSKTGLSDDAKRLLFGVEHKRTLDDIATVSTRFKELNKFANPSGTGQSVFGAGAIAGLVVDPVTTLGVLLGARGLASHLARPAAAKEVARWSRASLAVARNPGDRKTRELLGRATRRLAVVIATDAGVPDAAPRIEQELLSQNKI